MSNIQIQEAAPRDERDEQEEPWTHLAARAGRASCHRGHCRLPAGVGWMDAPPAEWTRTRRSTVTQVPQARSLADQARRAEARLAVVLNLN
jgi:hypothetical protein